MSGISEVAHGLRAADRHDETTSAGSEEKPEAQEVQDLPTEDELSGFYIFRAILTQMVDPQRVIIRDQKSYCSVLLDDSNRKPICRLWFNGAQKYIGLFDAAKVETRKPIENLAAIYSFSDHLRESVGRYESKPEKAGGSGNSDSTPSN